MDSVVRPARSDEPLAEVAQRGFLRASGLRFGDHDPDRPDIIIDDLTVLDLVFPSAKGMGAGGAAVDAHRWRLGHLPFSEDVARRRIPSGEVDTGRLADQAAPSVAPDEILCAQRLAAGERDVHASVVLRETGDILSIQDGHLQLSDPGGQDALEL